MKISVIIPTLNRPHILRETLESVSKQIELPFEVIVIDQSDSEETGTVCKEFRFVKYYYNDFKSSTHARNIGIRESNGDIIVFIDDDVELLPGYFESVIESFQMKPEAIAFCGNVINSKPFKGLNNVIRKVFLFDHSSDDMTILPNFLATSFTKNPSDYTEVFWTTGCNFCVKKSALQQVMFDENLIKYALAEDRDFSYRLSKQGKIYFNPHMKLVHKVADVSRIPSKIKVFMIFVHQMYLTNKNLGWGIKNRSAYWWNITGRLIFAFFYCFTLKSSSFDNLKNNILALTFIIRNKKEIKVGNLQKFHRFLNS
ncbi:MAG TPA: glycosyltransferase [Thermotogota bacterium]|nr:glycosyltransferase [Thermotogota bacterium]HQQ66739.1 glycosyltransferase [Thermotogota bacterium]